jgi:hypothetical protein
MVEAMLVLPILVIAITGASFVCELYRARAETRLAARACAWELAMRGCEGGAPASCEVGDGPADEGWVPDIAAKAKSQVGGSVDPFGDFPILGDAFRALFGTSTRATATAQVPFPFDDTRAGIARSEVVVLCNSVKGDVLELATEWLKEALP